MPVKFSKVSWDNSSTPGTGRARQRLFQMPAPEPSVVRLREETEIFRFMAPSVQVSQMANESLLPVFLHREVSSDCLANNAA